MTLVLIVIELLALAANVSLPLYQTTTLRWKAAAITRQLSLVRKAAESARQQRAEWPEDRAPGQAPPELAAYLPPGFTFEHADYQLDWEHWTLQEGPATDPHNDDLAGITVVTRDPRLAAMVARTLREGELRMTLGNRTTLVISGPEH